MEQMLRAKSFWSVFAATAIVFLLAGLGKAGLSESQTEILVIAKSEKAAANSDQLIETVRRIPLALSFYDRLLEKTGMDDQFAALPDYKRKAAWNKIVKVKRVEKTALLSVQAFAENPLEASELSRVVATDTALVASKYYDIRSELEVRIFDGPIAQTKKTFDLLKIIFSLSGGFVAGAIAFLLFSIWQRNIVSISIPRPKFEPKEFIATFPYGKPDFLSEEEKEIEEEKRAPRKEFPKAPTSGKKAAAPDNLPVGEEFVIQAIQAFSHKDEVAEEKKVAEIRAHEATPEEVKERLNRLLRGEM